MSGRGKAVFSDAQKAALGDKLVRREHLRKPRAEPESESTELALIDRDSPPLDVAGNFVAVMETLPDINHNQRKVAYLLARGWTYAETAAKCGVSVAYIKLLMRDQRIKDMIEVFRGGGIMEIVEDMTVEAVLDKAAIRAAEVLIEKMNSALDESNQIKSALEVLKLAGHGVKDGQEPKIVIQFERSVLDTFHQAKQEIAEADYEVID